MRNEEYEIMRLCKDIKRTMQDIGQSSVVTISGLLAERLYEIGWRRQDEGHHTETLNNAIDATFRGAVLRFAEKLKAKAFQGYQVGMYIVDTKTIDETAKEFLKYDK